MFDGLAAAIDEVLDLDCDRLSGSALSGAVVELEQLRARLDAAIAHVEGAWDRRGCWQADRARNGTAWLKSRCRLPGNEAARHLRLARAMTALPAAAGAWKAGTITGAHLDRLNKARTPETAALMERDEEMLVAQAAELPFDMFARALAYWYDHADPDGNDRDADRQHQRRSFSLSKTLDGVYLGDLRLDPLAGAAVANVLDSIYQELYALDQRTGRERTPTQRRADALLEMAIRAATPNKKGQRPAPLLTVLVGYETFAGRICQLDDGTAVAPGSLRGWLDRAAVERVVFDTPNRIIEVSERKRLFTGALRRAIEVRDRECTHKTCDIPASHCEIDHIIPYTNNGPTTQTNGRVHCGYHNRNRDDLHNGPPPGDGNDPREPDEPP